MLAAHHLDQASIKDRAIQANNRNNNNKAISQCFKGVF